MNTVLAKFLENTQKVGSEIPELCFIGNPVLRKATAYSSFEKAFEVCKKLEDSLLRIRKITGVGRGLAAPQIGSSERCFVTFVNEAFQYFINPKIIHISSSTNWYRENCLSCGPLWCNVERSETIRMSYVDSAGIEHEKEFTDFWARLLQHEYDHLNGIVNLDKAEAGEIALVSADPLKEVLRKTRD